MVEIIASGDTKAARKNHVCDWCGGAIPIGTAYHWSVNKFGGDVYRWKAHHDCRELAKKYADALDLWSDDGIPPMDDWEPEYFSHDDRNEFDRIMARVRPPVTVS